MLICLVKPSSFTVFAMGAVGRAFVDKYNFIDCCCKNNLYFVSNIETKPQMVTDADGYNNLA